MDGRSKWRKNEREKGEREGEIDRWERVEKRARKKWRGEDD